MPRSSRFAFENAFYHIFNRGINKQPIFLSDNDYKFFLEKLNKINNKYDHSIYAICLMPNHFHISVQTRKVPISKIMSSLGTSYSMYFNHRYKHFGPVFQNRYKSILIQNNTYFLQLSRYIYLNPVKDGLVKDPINYKYSSLREVLGKEHLRIIDKNIVNLVGESEKSVKEYEKFIYEGLGKDLSKISELFEKEEAVMGTTKFANSIQKRYLKRKNVTK